MAKLFSSEVAVKVANEAVQIHGGYGFITDYLAEAFHYQFKHTNRYEEVSRRVRLGKSIEGRDEKGIKKTLCAFLKILHPAGAPTDAEFEEYVTYAVECRRRVKEQMNKRKPDDEFANINLSFFRATGEEVVVFCPESKDAAATQEPARRRLGKGDIPLAQVMPPGPSVTGARPTTEGTEPEPIFVATSLAVQSLVGVPVAALKEQHYTILYGDAGHSYETILGPYLEGVKVITIEDPYIRLPHQIQNFVRFCEMSMRLSKVQRINLITGYDDNSQVAEISEKLDQLKQSLLEMDVLLDIQLNPNLHDREIRLDNGWTVKIGRGLDFYQRPGSWFEIGANDLTLRKCLETKVDIYKI